MTRGVRRRDRAALRDPKERKALELQRVDDGFRVAPPGDYPNLGFSNNPASAGGFEGNFYELAYGLNYKPTWNSNLIVRPEVRFDWYDGRDNALGNQPYDDGSDDSQVLTGFDVIYLY